MSRLVFESKPPFIQIRCSEKQPFYFARRKGKDSIAVLLYHMVGKTCWVLVRRQPLVHQADGESLDLFPCPITGSIDDGESPEAAALRECREEAGYALNDLHSLGSYIVGTQTDEVVHLYCADVTGMTPETATQDGTYHESISENGWESLSHLARMTTHEQCYSGLIIAIVRLCRHLGR